MKFDIIILVISIIILLVIFYKNFSNKEGYQPEIGEDIYKYQILPKLPLKELNNFAKTSKANLNTVKGYLQTFKNPPKLSNLNQGRYFSEVEIPYPEVLFQQLKERYPNRQDFVIQSQVRNQITKTKIPTKFSLRKIQELFELLEAKYQNEITIPETKEQEESHSALIDSSNLPVIEVFYPYYDVTFQYFTPFEIQGKDYIIKIIKRNEDAISIQIFIRRGTNQELEKSIEEFRVEMNSEIEPFLLNLPNPYEGIFGIKKYVRGSDRKTVEGQTYNFEFNKIKVMGPNEGYNLYKDLFAKKKGGNEFVIPDEDEEEKEE